MSTIASSTGHLALQTVRRVIVYTLLFALVIITAIGISGLLGDVLDARRVLAQGSSTALAQSLTFTLIGGPLTALLWWGIRKKLREPAEQSSVAWGLYLGIIQIVALITGASLLLTNTAMLVRGDLRLGGLAAGTVWLSVWAVSRFLARRPATRPTRLATVPAILGQVYALVITVGGSTTVLSAVFDEVIRSFTESALVGDPWWRAALASLVWAVGGGMLWWWFWTYEGVVRLRSGLANLAVILAGLFGSSVLTLVGIGTTLYVALRLAVDHSDPITELVDPLSAAVAATAVGGVVWLHYRRVLDLRSAATQEAGRLTVSGVALIAAASGLGVIVNATLAALAPALAGGSTRPLLLGGISALLVGGLVWWQVWRPRVSPEPGAPGSAARRVYLVAVFGLSAVVALVTLLVIGYRLFEILLDDVTGASLVDRTRAPLGLLTATTLVAGYHFILWRRTREHSDEENPSRSQLIEQVILVTGADAAAQSQVIHQVSGASVTVWRRAEEELTERSPGAPAVAEQIGQALQGVAAKRVLVVMGPAEHILVIPLQD